MKNVITFLITITVLTSCGPSLQVFSDYDKTADLSHYKTFSWLKLDAIEAKGSNPLYYNELNDKRIKEAVNKQMQGKNFQPFSNSTDLQLHYHIIVEDKTSTITEPIGTQYRPYSNEHRRSTYQYREGTIIIDLMDIKTNTLIWRGWATDVITNTVRKNPEAAIQNAIEKIFLQFPATGN